MFKVGGVIDAWREHDNSRVVDSCGCGCAQCVQQSVRVIPHRSHAHRSEEFGQRLCHDSSVRDDIAHAAGHANVVFEHTPGADLIADQVDSRDVNSHTVGALDSRRATMEVRTRADEARRYDTVGNRERRAIYVGQKFLEGAHSLANSELYVSPVILFNDARNWIKWEGALLASKIKGDALRQIGFGERVRATPQLFLSHLRQCAMNLRVWSSRRARFCQIGKHLVKRRHARTRTSCRRAVGVSVEQCCHGSSLPFQSFPRCFPEVVRENFVQSWRQSPACGEHGENLVACFTNSGRGPINVSRFRSTL